MTAPKHKSRSPEFAGACEPLAGVATVSNRIAAPASTAGSEAGTLPHTRTATASDPASSWPFVISCLSCGVSYSLAAFRVLQSLGTTLSDVPFDDPRVVIERRVCGCGKTLRIPIDCDGHYLAEGVWK